MDPQTTWNELLQAWSSRKWEAVIELSQALLGWLADGGFPPETQLPNELGADWNREVAFAACQFARQRAQQAIEDLQGIPRFTCLLPLPEQGASNLFPSKRARLDQYSMCAHRSRRIHAWHLP